MHLHFDCFAGISGDMVLGACVDLGVSVQWLQEQIQQLPLDEADLVVESVTRHGISAKKIQVITNEASQPRNHRDIQNLIQAAALSDRVKTTAADIFNRIAQAEAQIHDCQPDEVHFHEVGAVDSIVDIVGAAVCLEALQIESASCSALPLGSGFVDCAHGRLPVPAPATLELLKGLPVYGGESDGELVTPTGAGIVAAVATEFGTTPSMTIERIGYGSGSRDFADRPNLLRVLLGRRSQLTSGMHDDIMVVETNIDDMNPELYGYLMEKLFQEGAVDVCLIPATMKKNRPGIKLEVLCPPEKMDAVAACVLTETSTIGVRYRMAQRTILQRSMAAVKTTFGDIPVKCTLAPDGVKRYSPEYEACRTVAERTGTPLTRVYAAVSAAVQDEANLTTLA